MEKSDKIKTAVAVGAALLAAAAALKRRYYLLSELKGLKDEDMPEITIPSGYKKLIKLQSVQAGLYGAFVEEYSGVKKMYKENKNYSDSDKMKNLKLIKHLESELELELFKRDYDKSVTIKPKLIDAARFINSTKNIEVELSNTQNVIKELSKLDLKGTKYNSEYKKAISIITNAFKLHNRMCKDVLRVQKVLLDVIEKKSKKNLDESVLNEVAVANKEYQSNKKVYDEALKKGLAVWEATAKKKNLKPIGASEAIKIISESKVNSYIYLDIIKDLRKIKVGKWTVCIGNTNTNITRSKPIYDKNGKMNTAVVLAQKENGKVTLRNFPYKRFLNWDSSKVK